MRDPKSPATLYAGLDGGIFRSKDGGRSWLPISRGLPDDDPVGAVAIDPAKPETLPATVYAGTYTSGVFKSSDAEASWVRIPGSDQLHPDVTALALEPGNPATLYVGTGGGSAYRLDTRLLPKPAPATPSPRPRP